MFTRIALLLLAATALATLPADAQRGPRGGRGGDHGARLGQRPFSGMAMFSPRFLLRSQDRLELTDAQVDQLTTLQTEAATGGARARAALATHRSQLREALTADQPDPNAIRQHLEASQGARTQLEWAGLDAMLKASAVLTDDQREAVREMVAQRGPRRGGMQWRRRR